jgi:hypothetical protein
LRATSYGGCDAIELKNRGLKIGVDDVGRDNCQGVTPSTGTGAGVVAAAAGVASLEVEAAVEVEAEMEVEVVEVEVVDWLGEEEGRWTARTETVERRALAAAGAARAGSAIPGRVRIMAAIGRRAGGGLSRALVRRQQ